MGVRPELPRSGTAAGHPRHHEHRPGHGASAESEHPHSFGTMPFDLGDVLPSRWQRLTRRISGPHPHAPQRLADGQDLPVARPVERSVGHVSETYIISETYIKCVS